MKVCLYSDTCVLYIFTSNGILLLLIIIDNLAAKLNKYIT